MPVIEITSLEHPGVEVFSTLTEAQLRNRIDPQRGIFIAESPKVIRVALEAGYEPVSLLCERKHLTGDAEDIVQRMAHLPVYTGDRELLARLTGYTLTRGVLALTACSGGSSELDPTPKPTPSAKVPINISTSILSRATDLAFEAGDQIGLFVVNHQADGSAATLQTTGNYIDNTKFTYDGTWKAATPTYWKDNSTPADFYIYYPYTSSISNIEAMPWTVNADQSTTENYKASELLIGKTTNAAPTESAVKIEAKHVLSQMIINLVAGNGFTEASLAAAKISVKINRLKTQATANLSTGAVTAKGDDTDLIPLKEEGNSYKALIIPQAVGEGNLITVNVDGRDFNLPKSSKFSAFEAGRMHKFTVTLSKTSNGVNVNISKWEDDGIDYGGTAE